MKKTKNLLIALFFGVGILSGCVKSSETVTQLDNSDVISESIADEVGDGKVLVVINDGDNIATYSASVVSELTVLEALIEVVDEQEIAYEIEHYEFGDLITSIGGKANSSERSWIYFVNSLPGNVGAGERAIVDGDVIEWNYIEPIY